MRRLVAAAALLAVSVPTQVARADARSWRDEVQAPASRTVRPTAVTAADPRGGAIDGAPAAALRQDGKAVRLTSTGERGTSPLLTLDFGGEVAGRALVRVLGASADRPGLHVCYSESRRYMATAPGQNGGQTAFAPGCDTANIWSGYPGQPYQWDADSHTLPLGSAHLPATLEDGRLRGGFRYATIFLDEPGWVDVDAVAADFTAAPGQANLRGYRGHFLSSDEELNRIWYAGAYTVQIDTDLPTRVKGNIAVDPAAPCWPYQPGEADHADNTLHYADPKTAIVLDGGKRDRDPFTGDLGVEGPVAYLSTGDVAAVRNTLDALARQRTADGFVPGNGQVCPDQSGHFSGDYDLWFVHDVYLHWLYTADPKALGDWWPAVTGALDWAVRQIDDSGLVAFGAYGGDGGCGTYAYSSCDHLTYTNAGLYRALRETARMARAKGRTGMASSYEATAASLRTAVEAKLWDDTAGAYRQSVEHPDVHPQDATAFAVSSGLAAPGRAQRSLAWLRSHDWGPYGSLTVPAGTQGAAVDSHYEPLPSGTEADARFGVDDASGLELIRRGWGYQLAQDPGNTFWEKTAADGTPGLASFTSLAHGWTSQPTVTLTNRVLGVTPTDAGFARFTVQPHPAGLTWAEGTVPTPRGDIAASWRDGADGFRLAVTVPGRTTGRLAVPIHSRVTLDGRVVWAGGRATAKGVTSDGAYVHVDGVAPGHHTMEGTR
ncbi:alpha-L-rhamnosidase C-terminal domain-containing protein [Actinoallomurus iriomotensis]|uniref:Alpha-L-rhamnosidase n=1 Tax=Actinoallomurus iriomotensis TaxID=478107 RepID=A0A9W6VPC5_9ACTN|nr:alpha-L-rhamnosidase C-terminal domain-containing protein [Actinoallomurus iriomotensis]GLY74317.1 hypothetical protein Airi01_025840 [Actinoallomurus iriomotensis]